MCHTEDLSEGQPINLMCDVKIEVGNQTALTSS